MLKDFDKFMEACEHNVVTLVAVPHVEDAEQGVGRTYEIKVTSDVALADVGVYVLGEFPFNHTNNVFECDTGAGMMQMKAIDWHIEI